MTQVCPRNRYQVPLSMLLRALTSAAWLLHLSGPTHADGPSRERRDFRGVWVGDDGHCRWANDFNLVYDRKTAAFPLRGSGSPSLHCRILSVTGQQPVWKLRLACRHWDPGHLTPKPFEVRQTIRMIDDGLKMLIETEPFRSEPARTELAFYCRRPSDPEPVLMCFSEKKGHTVPCEP